MAQSTELRTSLKQRIGIIVVTVILLGSTIALYMGIVLNYNNGGSTTNTVDPAKQARFNELSSQYQAKVDAEAANLSTIYFSQFSPYKNNVRSFNAAAITEVATTDLKVGDGAEIIEGSTDYSAYYIGWLSDETIFDSSFNSTTDPTSLKHPLAGGQMIEGWNQGIIGMKIGGVREISIPAALAYGDQQQGSIPANSPLKFIVMLIPRVADIEYPEELDILYNEIYGTAQ